MGCTKFTSAFSSAALSILGLGAARALGVEIPPPWEKKIEEKI